MNMVCRLIIWKFNSPAGVLSVVIGLALVITIICSSMIILAYYHRVGQLNFALRSKLVNNAESGFEYILANSRNFDSGNALLLDLYGNESDSVKLEIFPWGMFQIGKSKAFRGSNTFTQAGWIGNFPNDIGKSALFIADEQKPISIAGNTLIKGNVFLPKAGIKAGQVGQIGYSRNRLVYGNVSSSAASLPSANLQFIDRSLAYLNAVTAIQRNENQEFRNSFLLPLKAYDISEYPIISEIYEGHIALISANPVLVKRHARLDHVIIYAPSITVENGFEGNFQGIATNLIQIEENVRLNYPSALMVASGESAEMTIGQGSVIEGIIYVDGNSMDANKTRLNLSNKSKVIGHVYCDGLTDLKGEINGHISCRKFFLQTPSSIRENFLFNAKIDHNKLPSGFIGSPMFHATEGKEVIEWVY